MGRDKNKGGGKSSTAAAPAAAATETAPNGGIVLTDAARRKLSDLSAEGMLNANDRYQESMALASVLGLKFLGHRPHGANDKSKRTGLQVIQNVIDGVQEPKRTHLIHCIQQDTGIVLK
jgi:hypothetical protein